MHFIDYLFHLLYLLFWILKSITAFTYEYVLPAIAFVVPILAKSVSQIAGIVLRIFFLYVSPCVLHTVAGLTYLFTRALGALNAAATKLIESNVNLEVLFTTIIASTLFAIVYFRATGRVWRFVKECILMSELYVRLVLDVGKMLLVCVTYIYGKAARRTSAERGLKAIEAPETEQKYTDEIMRSTQKSLTHMRRRHRRVVKPMSVDD